MKKRKQYSPTLSNVGVTPVAVKNTTGYETDRELKARLRREEEQAQLEASPVYQYERTMTNVMRERRRLAVEFWKRPVEELLRDKDSEVGIDPTFDPTVYRTEYDFNQAHAAFDKWFAETLTPSGVSLSESGGQRLVRFALTHAKAGRDLSEPSNWQLAYLFLRDELNAFAEGELIGYTRPKAASAPAPKPTLESLNISGNEDDAKTARRITRDGMFAQGSPLHHEWLVSLYEGFGGFRPSEDDLYYIYQFAFPRNNLSYVDKRSFDFIRRHMCAIGRWDSNRLLTEDERLCKDLDAIDTSNMSFDEKQALRAKLLRQRKQNY